MSPKQQFTVMFSVFLGGCTVEAADRGADAEGVRRISSASCRSALSASEETTALQLIDDICGDTWCEGDDNFAFERLSCHAGASESPNGGSCTLKLRLIPRDDSQRSYSRTCTTRDFFGFDSLVETSASGYQSLAWDYYLALTDCINELEAALPR